MNEAIIDDAPPHFILLIETQPPQSLPWVIGDRVPSRAYRYMIISIALHKNVFWIGLFGRAWKHHEVMGRGHFLTCEKGPRVFNSKNFNKVEKVQQKNNV
jgi:hypothetical protein